MPMEKSSSVAGLVNFMRNIGSSVGTSMVTTVIARRAQFHQVFLVSNITSGQRTFADATAALSAYCSWVGSERQPGSERSIRPDLPDGHCAGDDLAYVDTFLVLAVNGGCHVCAFLRIEEE